MWTSLYHRSFSFFLSASLSSEALKLVDAVWVRGQKAAKHVVFVLFYSCLFFPVPWTVHPKNVQVFEENFTCVFRAQTHTHTHRHTQTHTALCVWLGAICCWALCWRVNCRDTAVRNSVPRRVVPALKSHSTIALPPLAPTEPISCPSLSRVPGAWPSTSFYHHLWHVWEKNTVRDPGPQPGMQTHIVQPLFQSTQLGQSCQV